MGSNGGVEAAAGASQQHREGQWRRLLALRLASTLVAVGVGLVLLPDDRRWLFAVIVGAIHLPVTAILHLAYKENPRPPSFGWLLLLGADVAVVSTILAMFPAVAEVALLGLTLIVIVNAQFFGVRWGLVVSGVAWAGVAGPTVFGDPPGAPTLFGAILSGPLLGGVGFVVGTLADEERRAATRSRRLSEAIASVGSSVDLAEVLTGLCRAACAAVGASFAVVLSEQHGTLTLAAEADLPAGPFPEADGILTGLLRDPDRASAPTPTAFRTGRPVLVPDLQRDPSVGAFGELIERIGARSMAAMPVAASGRCLAVLNLYLPRPHRFRSDEVAFLEAIAEHAGVAMERSELFSRERETSDRLRELDRLRSEFVATMSHELRTPLTGIVGFAVTLRSKWKELDDDLRNELLERVEDNARGLEHLITHLLDFSRLERGAFRVTIGEHDAAALARRVLQNMAPSLERHHVRLAAAAPTLVRVDPYAFERILGNLLSNAAKFSPEGSAIRLTVGQDGPMVRIAVRDEGPGIAPEVAGRIFERFFRGPHGSAAGAGIGLTVVRELVELHDGRVEGRNAEPGPGAIFTVWLPRAAGSGAEG